MRTFLHTLHTDVWGPASSPSFDGFWFYLLIVDEYSWYVWQFPMTRNLDVVHLFSNFLTLIEN